MPVFGRWIFAKEEVVVIWTALSKFDSACLKLILIDSDFCLAKHTRVEELICLEDVILLATVHFIELLDVFCGFFFPLISVVELSDYSARDI